MAKFYIQSGTLRAIVDSADADRAALWAIHHTLECVTPLAIDDLEIDGEAIMLNRADTERTPKVLGETIALSELGFDDPEALVVDTWQAFHEWYALLRAVEKLEKLFID